MSALRSRDDVVGPHDAAEPCCDSAIASTAPTGIVASVSVRGSGIASQRMVATVGRLMATEA